MPEHYSQPPEQEMPATPEDSERLDDSPRIYVASLADYNAGRLHGAWLDAESDVDTLRDGITAILSRSPELGAEEWAIHDYDGFHGLRLGEHESLDRIVQLAHGVREHGPAFAAFADWLGDDEHLEPLFQECYRGEWASAEEYASDLLEDLHLHDLLHGLPDWLAPYVHIDVEGFARDLQLGGDILVVPGERNVYVFETPR